MRALASAIFSAIRRRRPTTLIVLDRGASRCSAGDGAARGPRARKASRSSWVMRPAGPVPGTWRRSMPASRARRRTAGEASGLLALGRGAPRGLGAAGAGDRRCGARRPSAAGGRRRRRVRAARLRRRRSRRRGSAARRRRRPSLAGDLRAGPASEPTATMSPTSAPSQRTLPSTGEGISTVALSVITAASTVSSRTRSPTLTCHSTSSASATPSPTSGSLMTCSAMLTPPSPSSSAAADARRAREVVPFLGVRIGRVPAGDALDRRLEVVEAVLLHERGRARRRSRR